VEIGLEEDPKKRWKDNLKMDFRGIVCENRWWMDLLPLEAVGFSKSTVLCTNPWCHKPEEQSTVVRHLKTG
jgi:hypothetical protein